MYTDPWKQCFVQPQVGIFKIKLTLLKWKPVISFFISFPEIALNTKFWGVWVQKKNINYDHLYLDVILTPMEMNARALLPDAGLPGRLLTIVCIHLTFNMTALYDWQKKYSKDCSYIEDE